MSASTVACVLVVALAITSGLVAAQAFDESWEDDFEDGDADGWSLDPESAWAVESDGPDGGESLTGETASNTDTQAVWSAGPFLDMDEEFVIEGTVRSRQVSGGDSSQHVRLGLLDDVNDPDANALLMFNHQDNVTMLSSQSNTSASEEDDVIDNSFEDEWVQYQIESDGDGELTATVWEYGTSEPSEPQLNESFDGVAGEFSMDIGQEPNPREVSLASVSIEGTAAVDDNLTLETSSLLRHGERNDYTVKYTSYNNETERNETVDVTDNATVSSLNTDGITVNESANELVATDDESFNERVTVRAEYDEADGAAFKEVTVAEVSVENLEVLPPVYRFSAFLGDWTVFFFVISIGAGIVGTRIATSFMGLSMMEMVLLMGWFGGYISTGLVLTSVFACLFIGLNLAANIDYQVTR